MACELQYYTWMGELHIAHGQCTQISKVRNLVMCVMLADEWHAAGNDGSVTNLQKYSRTSIVHASTDPNLQDCNRGMARQTLHKSVKRCQFPASQPELKTLRQLWKLQELRTVCALGYFGTTAPKPGVVFLDIVEFSHAAELPCEF